MRVIVPVFLTGLVVACGTSNREGAGAASSEAAAVRIVSLVPAASAIFADLGVADRVVGRALDDRTPAVAAAPVVGRVLDPSLERIVALRPDLIVAWAGRDLTRLDEVSVAAGARLVRIRLDRVADVAPACVVLARAAGVEAGGVRLAARLAADLERVRLATRALNPVRVLWIVWGDPLIAVGPGTHLDDLLAFSGARNVLADEAMPWPRPSLETLIARDPEVVIWSGPPGAAGVAADASDASAGPLRVVTAVLDGRVVRVDRDLFHEAGPALARAAATLAVALHPEVTSSLSTLLTETEGIHP